MLGQEVMERMIKGGGVLRLSVHYDSVALRGTAQCDLVTGASGKPMLRAKFGHSVKAILDFDLYGNFWEIEEQSEAQLR